MPVPVAPSGTSSNGAAPDTAEHVLHNVFFAAGDGSGAADPFTLVLLNYQLPSCTLDLWHKASYRICADGGANRLHDLVQRVTHSTAARAVYAPDVIMGDLDSLRADVRAVYEQAGIKVVKMEDQDSTDLEKSLSHVCSQLEGGCHATAGNRPTVVAVGGLGGRLDHTLANLALLGRYAAVRVVLVGDGNAAQLVPAGRTTIRPVPGLEGPTCGLVPLFGAARVTTSGLRWNLADEAMGMNGLISTSNLLVGGQVEVHTDAPLIWTVELREASAP